MTFLGEDSDVTDAELFVLYWLQFFGRPMTTDGLNIIWARRRAALSGGGMRRLPIAELLTGGYVRYGDKSMLELVRDRLSVENLREIWAASEKGGWAVSYEFLCSKWTQKAFKLRTEDWYYDARPIVDEAINKHVIFRWGLYAERCFDETLDRLRTDIDIGDDRSLFERVTKSIGNFHGDKFVRHSGPDSFADIVAIPEGMPKALANAYMTMFRNPHGDYEERLMQDILNVEGRSLRGGQSAFSEETEAELVAQQAALDFLGGDSVRWAVERLNALRQKVVLSPNATLLLMALAFWRGDFETVGSVNRESPFCIAHKRSVAAALELARDGAFAEADKELTGALGIQYYSISDQWHLIDFPILLVLLICKVRAGGGGNIQMLKKLVRVLDGLRSTHYYRDNNLRAEFPWCFRFISTLPGTNEYGEVATRPKRLPFVYLHALAISLGHKGCRLDLDFALESARRALANGYPSIAADIVSVAQRADGDLLVGKAKPEDFEKVGADPKAVFAAPREMSHFWERALDALEKAMPHAAAPKRAARAGREPDLFCWGLELETGHERLKVSHAYPILCRRLRDGSLAEPSAVAGKSLIDGKYDDLLTPADRTVKMDLVSRRCVTVDLYGDKAAPTIESLRLMSGMENLFCSTTNYSYGHWCFDRRTKQTPLSLTVEPAKLNFAYRPDGSVEIAVPVMLKDISERLRYTVERKTDKRTDAETWRILEITPDYLAAVKALAQVAPEKRLVIPAEGAPRVEAFCSAISDEAPVAWTRAAAGRNDAEIPRVAAAAAPLVRLVFADGALGASVMVRLSDEPAWSSEPGRGVPERLVVRKDASRVLLTRDFAAEEASVVPARAALAKFGDAKTDECHWYFSGVAESLDALVALHAATQDGAFALEWPEGESLKLSELVSHATRVEGGETADYWLGMSGEFKLDDGKVLSFVELLNSFDAREGAYVRLDEGRYLRLSAALARRLEALKGAGIERGGKLMISPAAIPALEKVARETEADDVLPLPEVVKNRLETIRAAFAKSVPPPGELRCQMRPYQSEGFEWLARLDRCGIGACLADDMGLGKTVQLIALLLERKAEGASLVVAPASVAFNWRDEIARFAPTLRVALVGQASNGADEDVARAAKTHDVVVTSYGVLASREEQFAAVEWNILVLDEAQAIKNHLTRRAQSVKRLRARFRAVATGTPIENRLTELWSIFDFLNPGMLGGEARFNRELAPHGEASARLKRLVKPLILRRLKRDVLTDLPEKEEITVNVVLGDEERHAYEATRMNALAKLQAGDPENKIAILAELTRLRRFCCHPSLVMPSVLASAKLDALEDLLENLRSNNHRALVFSQFVDYLSIVRKMLERHGWSYQYLDGATPKTERERGVAAFQAGEGDFYLISLKAGGMGLNLTAANYVILLDPWWNPAVENQAADRVHRIGQHLPVTVYRLIAQDTIEEKVVRLHAKKTALAEDVLAGGASSLSAAAMLELLGDAP